MKQLIQAPGYISETIAKDIQEIIFDYHSGSQELTEKILKLLLRIKSRKTFEFVIQVFKKNFKSFEAIQNILHEIENRLNKYPLNNIKYFIRKRLNTYNKRILKIFKKLKPKLFREIKFLTISNSKTIFDLLKQIHSNNYNPMVFVLKSFPGGEGKILFHKLKTFGISSELIDDSKISPIIDLSDIVLIGADRILAEKWFINKIGTKKLVKLANKKSKPVFLIALNEKFIKTERYQSYKKEKLTLRYDRNLFEKIELNLISEIFIA